MAAGREHPRMDASAGTAVPRGIRPGWPTALIVGVTALTLAVLLGSFLTRIEATVPSWDELWAQTVVAMRSPAGDAVGYALNWLGGGFMAVFVIPIGAAVLLLIARRPWGALFFVVASAASAGVVQVLKHLFGRARPEDMIVTSDFGSFPSGHVANAATIAVVLALLFPRVWVWIAGAVYVAVMAISRTYLGAHWFTDTVGGALVGLGVVMLLWAALRLLVGREREVRAQAARDRAVGGRAVPVQPQ